MKAKRFSENKSAKTPLKNNKQIKNLATLSKNFLYFSQKDI